METCSQDFTRFETMDRKEAPLTGRKGSVSAVSPHPGSANADSSAFHTQPVFPRLSTQRKDAVPCSGHTESVKEERDKADFDSEPKAPWEDFAKTEVCVKQEWPLHQDASSKRVKLDEANQDKGTPADGVDQGLVIKLEPDCDADWTFAQHCSGDRSRVASCVTSGLSGASDADATAGQQTGCTEGDAAVPIHLYHNDHHKMADQATLKTAHPQMTKARNLSADPKTPAGQEADSASPSPECCLGAAQRSESTQHVKNRRKRPSRSRLVLSCSRQNAQARYWDGAVHPDRPASPPPSQPTQVLDADAPQAPSSAEGSRDAMATDSPLTCSLAKPRGKRPARFICKDCGMGFRWQSRFDEHQRKHSGERPFICGECGDAFSSSSYLRVHQRKHRGLFPYPCTICGQEFMHGRHLTAHRKLHAEEGAFTCLDCNLRCWTPGELNRHRQTEHPEDASNKPYVCDLCPAAFQRSYHLETHMRSHTGEKPFLCNLCGQSYSTQGSLKVHTRSHTGEKPFKCTECQRAFVTSGQLKKHSRTHNKPIVTVSDDSKTVYVQTLKPAQRAGEGTAADGRRSSGAASLPTLTLEIQSYPAASAYSCEVCGAVFVRSCDLASHIRHDHPAATGKDNVCRECGMRFSRAHTLKVHRRTHSGTKPYQCATCRKHFAQRSNLTAHQRTHSRQKPYRRPVCDVGYSSAEYRHSHAQRHGEVRPCACAVCGAGFSSLPSLAAHLRSHERGEVTAACAHSAAGDARPPASPGLDGCREDCDSVRVKIEPFHGEGNALPAECGRGGLDKEEVVRSESSLCEQEAVAISARDTLCGQQAVAVSARDTLCGQQAVVISSRDTLCGQEAVAVSALDTLCGQEAVAVSARDTLCGQETEVCSTKDRDGWTGESHAKVEHASVRGVENVTMKQTQPADVGALLSNKDCPSTVHKGEG